MQRSNRSQDMQTDREYYPQQPVEDTAVAFADTAIEIPGPAEHSSVAGGVAAAGNFADLAQNDVAHVVLAVVELAIFGLPAASALTAAPVGRVDFGFVYTD